jgi:hypothetical protein
MYDDRIERFRGKEGRRERRKALVLFWEVSVFVMVWKERGGFPFYYTIGLTNSLSSFLLFYQQSALGPTVMRSEPFVSPAASDVKCLRPCHKPWKPQDMKEE